jgi:prephenate dehydrogenase
MTRLPRCTTSAEHSGWHVKTTHSRRWEHQLAVSQELDVEDAAPCNDRDNDEKEIIMLKRTRWN